MRLCALIPAALILLGGCTASRPPSGDATEARIARVGSNLRRAVQVKGAAVDGFRLTDRMARYHTPGVTIAVADSGRIVWARAYGLKEAGTSDSVTPATLFQAGSISKPVAATAMLRLVDQGTLSLDENVNSYLTSWKVPDNRFTAAEKVTLRRLVSHNAGLTVHGFPGYAVTDSLPTVPQVLDGQKPANTAAVRVDTLPGAIWRYSGGGTTVMQQLLADVSGTPFPALLKREVFDPIGMRLSTYEQPVPAARVGETAAAHKQDGTVVPGRWHIYPEMAAAGLWTTPSELLQWAIAITASRDAAPGAVLSPAIAREMLTIQKEPTGLGPFLDGSGRGFNFGHGGADEGFHARLIYFPETGQGAAVMVNSNGGPPMLSEILYAIAEEYDWPDFGPREVVALPLDSVAMAAMVGDYGATEPVPLTIKVTSEAGKLIVESEFTPRGEAVLTAPDTLVLLESGAVVGIQRDGSGQVTGLLAGPFRTTRKP